MDQPGSETPDLASLYVSLAPKLERIMRREVGASEGVIEEACQFAWAQLVCHLAGVNPDAALAWLVRTAVREACRMTRNGIREPSLEAVLESAGDTALPPAPVGPEELFEARDRLASLRALPARQQRLVWLGAFGLSYAEMAAHEGCTRRTAERQLLRARAVARQAA